MARSSYTYVVEQKGAHEYTVIGAFTVRYEMVNALPEDLDDDHPIRITRFSDGRMHTGTNITAQVIAEVYA